MKISPTNNRSGDLQTTGLGSQMFIYLHGYISGCTSYLLLKITQIKPFITGLSERLLKICFPGQKLKAHWVK